jgi:hypothetical protein
MLLVSLGVKWLQGRSLLLRHPKALDGLQIAELSQPGAVLVTDTPVSERVSVTINQEKVGEGRLCVYEGRFALEVQ